MSAKEMFEELDMEQKIGENYIEYYFKNDIDYPYGYYGFILFDLKINNYYTNIADISKYQNAIDKQISELGW